MSFLNPASALPSKFLRRTLVPQIAADLNTSSDCSGKNKIRHHLIILKHHRLNFPSKSKGVVSLVISVMEEAAISPADN